MPFSTSSFFLFACIALIGAALVCLQLVREKMFNRLLKTRIVPLDSSWDTGTRKTSLKMQHIWGETSKRMLRDKETRNLVICARVISVLMYLGISGAVLSMSWIGISDLERTAAVRSASSVTKSDVSIPPRAAVNSVSYGFDFKKNSSTIDGNRK